MKRPSFIFALVVFVGVVLLLLQRQSIMRLRAEHESLSRQVQEMSQQQAQSQWRPNVVAPPDSPQVNRELLRLRSEVTMLHQLTNDMARQEENYHRSQASQIARESNNFALWVQSRLPADQPLEGTFREFTNSGRRGWVFAGPKIWAVRAGPTITNDDR